jgi:predicted ATPase
MQRDTQTVLELSERLLALATKFETFKGARDGAIFNCWAQLQMRHDPVLLARMRDCIEQFDATQYWALLPFFMTSAAELMAKYGDLEGATTLVNRAAELVELTGEQWSQSEVMRLQACLCARDFDHRVCLLHAGLDKARQQNAKLWELRCATSLAKLWLEHGSQKAAREVLAPVLAWFPDSADFPDLVAARELLSQMGGELEDRSKGPTENSEFHLIKTQ